MVNWVLQHDLRSPEFGPPHDVLYRQAIEMCAWADDHGCPRVVLSEHHGAADGYLPSPLVMAAAVAARTTTLRIMVSALVLSLRHPVAAAEDAVVVDVISGGRLELTLAAGYVPSEFEMFGVDFDRRGQIFSDNVEVFLKAITGEPFVYEGRTIHVTPKPVQRPRPFVALGGSAPKRAARLADAYLPPVPDQALVDAYVAECRRLGKGDGIVMWPGGPMWVFVAHDPERAWAQIGPHAVHETNAYGAWSANAPGANPWRPVADVDEVRAGAMYAVVTPAECVALAKSLGDSSALRIKPLVGGLDPAVGWESLELFVSDVVPALGSG
jgi:alkanesulfonate monooxygenase SsuD/methylene tetrahydromethanopterin reductase-like flavin-dependent oxidoreductase (luciferase family)